MGKLTATSQARWFGIMAGIGLMLLAVRAATWAQQPPEVRPGVPPTRPVVLDPSENQNASHPARARLDLARKAQEIIQRLHETGNSGGQEELNKIYLWSRRAVEAQKDIGGKKAELIAAIEDHLARMRKSEAIAKALQERGQVDMLGMMEAQYRSLEAETWLAEAKANK